MQPPKTLIIKDAKDFSYTKEKITSVLSVHCLFATRHLLESNGNKAVKESIKSDRNSYFSLLFVDLHVYF